MTGAEQLQELALRLSAFTETLTRQAERLLQESQQNTRALQDTARHFAGQSGHISQQLVQAVAQQTRSAIDQGAKDGLLPANEALRRAGQDARQATAGLSQVLDDIRRAQRGMAWKAGAVLIVGCLLAITGSGYAIWQARQTMAQASFTQELLDATQSGALTRCGETLCARVDAKARRFGTKGEFAEIR